MAVTVVMGAGACSGAEPEARRGPIVARGPEVTIDAQLISSLEEFDACDDLLGYLRTEGAKVVGPYGFGGILGDVVAFSRRGTASADAAGAAEQAAPPAPTTAPVRGEAYSATNVQEDGVDEPDLVKTDGRRLVTIAAGHLRVVDVTGEEPRLTGSLSLDAAWSGPGELFLVGDRVVVLRPAYEPHAAGVSRPLPQGDAVTFVPPVARQPRTRVTVVDVSDPASPTTSSELTVDGDLVASRMVDGVARLVLRSGPPNLPFLYPSGAEASVAVAEEANKRAVAESTLEDWLPGFIQDGGERRGLTDCRDVSRPETFSGVGMLSVVTVDVLDPRPGPAATVVGAGETVYASASSLYVTSNVWQPCPPTADCVQAGTNTDVHEFDISDAVRTTYVASGQVKGRLLNQFSLSEHAGDLRVATTDDGAQESAVTVLRQRGPVLEPVGSVGGLGRTERIYAVRFLGDRAYVVTFRQTDPLYVIDLSDPTAPEVRGELKIPGYSAYLHPIGDDRLIGVGQDATGEGRVQGTQVSLFDVSDPADPKRTANATLPQSSSEAEYDHHAFLWWARTELAVLPVQSYGDGLVGAVGFRVSDGSVDEVGRVRHPDLSPIRRSLVVGDRLLTLSETGLRTSDVDSLAGRSWLAFA